MKNAFKYIFSSLLLLTSLSLTAGDNTGKKMVVIQPYLGHSNFKGGNIAKAVFDSLIKQGITAKDSAGNEYKVLEFTFGYTERNLYEDPNGRLVIMSDYLTEHCLGDTLTTTFQNFVFKDKRTKHGDTVYLDKVKVLLPEGRAVMGKSTRFVLTK